MKEQLISFKTAKLAKEKGFNIKTLYFYTKPGSKMLGINKHGNFYFTENINKKLYNYNNYMSLYNKNIYPAPTQSLLQKYLLKKYNIFIKVYPIRENNKTMFSTTTYYLNEFVKTTDKYGDTIKIFESIKSYNYQNTPEITLEDALYETLEIL